MRGEIREVRSGFDLVAGTWTASRNAGVGRCGRVADHASVRATQFYDCRRDETSLDEVERIGV